MTAFRSAIYVGKVTHKRLRPKSHFLRYRMFYMLFDIDEIDRIAQAHRLFSRNRFNVFSFFDGDHGNKSEAGNGALQLRAYVENHLRSAGMTPDGGAIRLMSMPRIFGYVFNPLSVYFCYDRAGDLTALIYEVDNTFGQRHSYVFPLEGTRNGSGPLHQRCVKEFYVSPFMEMGLRYDFTITLPDEVALLVVNGSDAEGLIIATVFGGTRREFSDQQLLRLALAYPLLTLKVIAGIHWEALWIWLKGVALKPRPQTPQQTRTIIPRAVRSESSEDCIYPPR
jgi:uncharacterized protein